MLNNWQKNEEGDLSDFFSEILSLGLTDVNFCHLSRVPFDVSDNLERYVVCTKS